MKKEKRDIETTKKALLDASEKLMLKCNDPSEVTSRAITKEADVNLSMINYCFGSREALLYEVFSNIKKKAAAENPAFYRITSGGLSPKEKLTEIHFESVKMLISYYKYTKAITRYALLNRAISAERGSLEYIKEHFGGRKSENECRLIAYELSSLHELMVLRYEDIKSSFGVDLSDDETLKKVISDNISRFLDDESV